MIETEKGKRIEQILATDVTREQLAEALWCAERSQRMWHGCAEENRNFRLKAVADNAKLRELVRDLWLTGRLCEAIPDMRLQAKDGDWRTMQERVYEALGIEADE